jgi:UDP-glucose:(heptosyl)LPS alpha-1,3-glucosyltransferase
MPMKLAFCLFNYFPYGGLQRDFLRIAQACQQRGHEIHVYTMRWEGMVEPHFKLHLMAARGWQNHTRSQYFAEQVKGECEKESFDLVIGFNKMPYLDLYYAADVCYQARIQEQRGSFYRLLPRYRQLAAFEKAIFARGKATEIMLISPKQQPGFFHFYQTEAERFHLLPPGIAKDRIAPPHAADIRARTRRSYHLADHDLLLLMVGSGFKTKGLDRAIRGLAAIPAILKERTHLFVIGEDNPRSFIKLARRFKVDRQLHFLGGRPDVPDFMLAADLLLHPAYHENTGTVLLEAIVSGLPVLTVDSCGYAHYVSEAKAGLVLKSPFKQAEFNDELQKMIVSTERTLWQQNGLAFAKRADIYSLPEKTADLIEHVGQKRVST